MRQTLKKSSGPGVAVIAFVLATTIAGAQTTQMKAAPVTKPAPTATVTATPGASGATVERITCKGPLKYTLARVPERARPMLYDVTLDFKGADSANLKPGQCWREGGWDARGSLGGQQNGQLIHRVDLGKCPFFEKLVLEGGRIADYKVNVAGFASSWFDAATKAEGLTFLVEATWLGRSQNASAPAIHAVADVVGSSSRVSTCL